MDQAARRRYRAAMVAPGTSDVCRYCEHSVELLHVGAWCKACSDVGTECGAAEILLRRRGS